MSDRRLRPGRTVIALGAITVALASVVPIGYLFVAGISLSDIAHQFGYPGTFSALVQTVGLTLLVSLFAAILGVGCAQLVAKTTLPAPRLFTVIFTVPLAIPGFVSSYAAYSTQLTFVPRVNLVTSFVGAAVVMALTLYPYVFLPCVVAMRSIDPSLEEVVAGSRRHGWSNLWRVTLPALRPAIAAGLLIVALHVLAEYGAMVQLGRSTLTTKIMAEMLDYGDYQSARSLSLILAVLSISALVATRLVAGRSRVTDSSRGTKRPPRRFDLNWMRLPVAALTLLIPLAAIGPTVFMTARGLLISRRDLIFDHAQLGSALVTTLGYGVAAALIATLAALPVSWWINRRPGIWPVLAERVVWIAHAIPSAILALALVFLATRLVPDLYKTPAVLITAYVILFLPLAVANQRVGLESSRRIYDDMAASLGVGPVRTFARITLPLSFPGFVAGALLVGLDACKELTTTLMLIPFNARTLSTQLWATTNGESLDFTAAAPYAALLVLLGIPPVWFLVRNVLHDLVSAPRSGIRVVEGQIATS